MRCLFCKSDSTTSRSAEHIIPESLGNRSHTLPPGVVCDRCNNYFATKVEKPFLESGAISLLRFHEVIPSKRGRVPSVAGVLSPGYPAILHRHPGAEVSMSIDIPPEAIREILRQKRATIIVPAAGEPPPDWVVSRFMAKAALEAMASRLVSYPGGIDYLVDEAQLDPIRHHAKRGEVRDWPVLVRRIYDTHAKWIDEDGNPIQLLHEFDILHTAADEWYFVLALFGLELVINFGGPDIAGYERWLAENGGASPLYSGKNAGNGLRPERARQS